jgi:hypothetical protein
LIEFNSKAKIYIKKVKLNKDKKKMFYVTCVFLFKMKGISHKKQEKVWRWNKKNKLKKAKKPSKSEWIF